MDSGRVCARSVPRRVHGQSGRTENALAVGDDGGAAAGGDLRFPVPALPGGPAVPPTDGRIGLRDSADRQQPYRGGAAGAVLWLPVPARAGEPGGESRGGGRAAPIVARRGNRPGGAGAVHADPAAGIRGPIPGANHRTCTIRFSNT